MTNFASIQGPFLSGLRPKTFFAERKKMIDDASKHGNGGLHYFSGWNRYKKTNRKENSQETPSSKRVFLESLPWTLALAQLIYVMIF